MLVLDETSPQPREMLAAESHTAYGRLARLSCFMGGALHRCLKCSILFSGEKGTKPQPSWNRIRHCRLRLLCTTTAAPRMYLFVPALVYSRVRETGSLQIAVLFSACK